MDALRIVGMSEAAKKRAARLTAIIACMDSRWRQVGDPGQRHRGEYFRDPCLWLYPLDFADARKRLIEYGEATAEQIAEAYAKTRAELRIGERLRRCPFGHDLKEPLPCACFGSGVLPTSKGTP